MKRVIIGTVALVVLLLIGQEGDGATLDCGEKNGVAGATDKTDRRENGFAPNAFGSEKGNGFTIFHRTLMEQ